jgi:hypothetical protein
MVEVGCFVVMKLACHTAIADARTKCHMAIIMTKNVRDKIAAGLREAIAVARGEEKPARLYVPVGVDHARARGPSDEEMAWARKRAKELGLP